MDNSEKWRHEQDPTTRGCKLTCRACNLPKSPEPSWASIEDRLAKLESAQASEPEEPTP